MSWKWEGETSKEEWRGVGRSGEEWGGVGRSGDELEVGRRGDE